MLVTSGGVWLDCRAAGTVGAPWRGWLGIGEDTLFWIYEETLTSDSKRILTSENLGKRPGTARISVERIYTRYKKSKHREAHSSCTGVPEGDGFLIDEFYRYKNDRPGYGRSAWPNGRAGSHPPERLTPPLSAS